MMMMISRRWLQSSQSLEILPQHLLPSHSSPCMKLLQRVALLLLMTMGTMETLLTTTVSTERRATTPTMTPAQGSQLGGMETKVSLSTTAFLRLPGAFLLTTCYVGEGVEVSLRT